ncbi:MAG: M48 family metalloprotease [Candidatus Rokubacteria bacterium]|nr:M48 family metalloprotease [Candidatus Rokubacteria bacterium]
MKGPRFLPIWFALVASALYACATIGPDLASPEIDAFEKVLRAKSTRFFIDQNLRLQVVGTRLLKALPEQDRTAPYLGLLVGEATDILADTFEVPKREGVLILGIVPGGPAARGGLQAGDYIEKIGQKTMTTPEDLSTLAELELRGPTPVWVHRGESLVEASIEVEHLPWNVEFRVVEDNAVDAFATQGTITVTTGMLRFLRSDDELAIVVGHELAHITKRHTFGRVALTLPSTILGALASLVAPGNQRLITNVIERLFANLFGMAVNKVDRDMEREADIFALLYAHAAGYDPRAGSEVWERLAVELPSLTTAGLFAVHPPSSERLVRVRKITDALLSGVSASVILEQTTTPRDAASDQEQEPGQAY